MQVGKYVSSLSNYFTHENPFGFSDGAVQVPKSLLVRLVQILVDLPYGSLATARLQNFLAISPFTESLGT
jgi:hypothetical protein